VIPPNCNGEDGDNRHSDDGCGNREDADGDDGKEGNCDEHSRLRSQRCDGTDSDDGDVNALDNDHYGANVAGAEYGFVVKLVMSVVVMMVISVMIGVMGMMR